MKHQAKAFIHTEIKGKLKEALESKFVGYTLLAYREEKNEDKLREGKHKIILLRKNNSLPPLLLSTTELIFIEKFSNIIPVKNLNIKLNDIKSDIIIYYFTESKKTLIFKTPLFKKFLKNNAIIINNKYPSGNIDFKHFKKLYLEVFKSRDLG